MRMTEEAIKMARLSSEIRLFFLGFLVMLGEGESSETHHYFAITAYSLHLPSVILLHVLFLPST